MILFAVSIGRAKDELAGLVVTVVPVSAGQVELAGLVATLMVDADSDPVKVRKTVTVVYTLFGRTKTVQTELAERAVVVVYT